VDVAQAASPSIPELITRIQNLTVKVFTPAKIVINERTGTIVLGGDVKISPVSVIHGNLSVEVVTTNTAVAGPSVYAPTFAGNGQAAGGSAPAGAGGPQNPGRNESEGSTGTGAGATVVPETTVSVTDQPAQSMRLDEGADVDELVNGLHAIGTTSRDVIAILQAIKAEGGIQADVEVQ
jgi:flagellar P-ring protein precursor FlgI